MEGGLQVCLLKPQKEETKQSTFNLTDIHVTILFLSYTLIRDDVDTFNVTVALYFP